jgi:Fur family transcriptional regulator, ferric uptake regulator
MQLARPRDNVADSRIIAIGERATAARLAVLARLLAESAAQSHHELESSIRPALDRVTLYRVLDWLVEQGLAHRASGPDRVWRFMATRPEADKHAHFHCERCGAMRCLDEPTPRQLRLPRGFRGESVELTVRGCAG